MFLFLDILCASLNEKTSPWSSNTTTTDHDVDDFLPEQSDANQLLLKHAGEEALILTQSAGGGVGDDDTEMSDNDLPSDLIVPDSIPEIDEHTDNSSDEEELRCLTSPAVAYKTTATTAPMSGSMQFKSGHFKNRDVSPSSSSDDDSISKGLNFQDYNLVGNSITISGENNTQSSQKSRFTIPNLVSDLVNRGVEQYINKQVQGAVTAMVSGSGGTTERRKTAEQSPLLMQDSSDESEFEILNHDELNQLP